ncbi:MAG: hypothetical protein J3R72DRAFT_448180 [Linnemannia gamsii]|nr:MAG: hypothetical protein J3R72DRAFT_448180 [Linnemannia gamsii]
MPPFGISTLLPRWLLVLLRLDSWNRVPSVIEIPLLPGGFLVLLRLSHGGSPLGISRILPGRFLVLLGLDSRDRVPFVIALFPRRFLVLLRSDR